MTAPKRCISWIAVSSKPQTEKESPDEQRAGNREIIEVLGGKLVAELVVDGQSRELDSFQEACEEIEAYRQLDDLIRRRGADLIIVREVSRLGRTLGLLGQTVSRLHQGGIAVYSRAAPPTTLSAREQAASQGVTFMLAIESALAHADMQRLRTNHTFGMIGRAKKGLFPRGAKFGWRDIRDAKGKVVAIEVVPEAAAAIRFALESYVDGGRSLMSIFREMNRRGYPTATGVPWSYEQIHNLIRYIWTYAGYIEYNKHSRTGRPYYRGKAAWPPIIDEALAQRVVDERKRRDSARRAVESPYLFSGVCRCGVCDTTISARGVSKDVGRRYDCKNRCQGASVVESRLLRNLRDYILDLQQDKIDVAALVGEQPSLRQEYEQQVAAIDRQYAVISEQRKKYTRSYSLDAISEVEYMELMRESLLHQQALATRHQELALLLAHVESAEEVRARIEEIKQQGLARLESEDVPALNAWIRQHFHIIVRENRAWRIRILSSWGL